MRVVVTGSEGFVGKWLVKALKDEGKDVVGFDLELGHDLTVKAQVDKFIEGHAPGEIYHLAAISSVPASIDNPTFTAETNILGSIYLLEAAKKVGAKTLLASTGHAETNSSPYTASKLAMEDFAKLYDNVVITRAHNHAGPGQSDQFAVASFAKQIAMIEIGRQKFIKHGNLDSVRNYTDVRDIVRAYMFMMAEMKGTQVVASDNNTSMRSVLNSLCDIAKVAIPLEEDESTSRPATSFTANGPWGRTPWIDTLTDTLRYWRRIV